MRFAILLDWHRLFTIRRDDAGAVRYEHTALPQAPLQRARSVDDIRVSTVAWQTDQWNWNRGGIINYYAPADLSCQTNECRANSCSDNNGNVIQSQHWIPANEQMTSYSWTEDRFSYDALNRLKSVAEYHGTQNGLGSQDFAQAYIYDRWGNRTINSDGTSGTGINNKQFSVDPSTNRLGVPSGQSGAMSYDNAGNLRTILTPVKARAPTTLRTE